jgi:hypothetical protein
LYQMTFVPHKGHLIQVRFNGHTITRLLQASEIPITLLAVPTNVARLVERTKHIVEKILDKEANPKFETRHIRRTDKHGQ